MPRCCWTPTAPSTPARSRGSSRASPGCCRGCWRPTAPAVASPTPPTARRLRRGIAAVNRPMFLHELASSWLPAIPEVDRRLRSAPPARLLDLGCGLGASSIALARAYPRAQVLGVDLDQASVTEARPRQPTRASPTASPSWSATPPTPPPRPCSTWSPFSRHCTTWATRWGRCGRPADCWPTTAAFWSPTNAWPTPSPPPATRPSGSCTAGASCTASPATLAEHPVEASGTVLRTPTVARWAATAGFTGFEVLPIDNPLWRFYRMYG